MLYDVREATRNFCIREIKAYFFTDEFKKDDCFLVAEKVDKAPTGYLKKYINKNMERPLYRRFSCSRDLKRSKVLESVEVTDKAMAFKSAVLRRGFKLWTENKFARSFRYVVSDDGAGWTARGARRPPPSADSSIHDINDRNEAMLVRSMTLSSRKCGFIRFKARRKCQNLE